ncbi:MAG: isoprenyl transferase [Bacillota bacterium]|nr:isoprenyl transferase [Bacillota bacterium]HHU61855.1 isoprenyl transferase [Natronincola sp.]
MGKNKGGNVPKHVAIIMDGNGRWARKRVMPRFMGHRQGVKALKSAVRYASNQGIATLTVYAFSTENWQRPQEEVTFLLDLMNKTFVQEIDELFRENVRIVLVGDRESVSPEILEVWDSAEKRTAENTGLTLNVAFNYGARQELVKATQLIAEKVLTGEMNLGDITSDCISESLYTAHSPDPDLIIRTGGEMRLSNFLLWQAAYSEIVVMDVLWPDFNEKHFSHALDEYSQRERRFGKVPVKE